MDSDMMMRKWIGIRDEVLTTGLRMTPKYREKLLAKINVKTNQHFVTYLSRRTGMTRFNTRFFKSAYDNAIKILDEIERLKKFKTELLYTPVIMRFNYRF